MKISSLGQFCLTLNDYFWLCCRNYVDNLFHICFRDLSSYPFACGSFKVAHIYTGIV
jgi:hypothetical protein